MAACSGRFFEQTVFRLEFSSGATARLVNQAAAEGKTVRGYCESQFKELEYGLKLVVKNNPDVKSFRLDERDVESPQQTLTSWIKKSYEGK